MIVVEYRLTYAEGQTEVIRVEARNISTGFAKALRMRAPSRALHSVEFWQVVA